MGGYHYLGGFQKLLILKVEILFHKQKLYMVPVNETLKNGAILLEAAGLGSGGRVRSIAF